MKMTMRWEMWPRWWKEIDAGKEGRIKFRGTTWQATSSDYCALETGVVIRGRKGSIWQVGPMGEDASNREQGRKVC